MRILIADDQALFRDALSCLLEEHGHEVVARAASCSDAVTLAVQHTPDIVLLDVCEPISRLVTTTREISERVPSTAVIILTDQPDELLLFRAVAAGAKGYLTKRIGAEQFCALLDRIERGEPALTPILANRLLQAFVDAEPIGGRTRTPSFALTERERTVLETMVTGVTSNRDLAATLGVSENTVRFHVRNILDKFQLHSRAAAIAFALQHGIVHGSAAPDQDLGAPALSGEPGQAVGGR